MGGHGGVKQRLDPALCHASVPICMIGVFDTVTVLGLRLPLLWMLTEPRFRFHDSHLGAEVEHGVQALALDETRAAFQPVIWDSTGGRGRSNRCGSAAATPMSAASSAGWNMPGRWPISRWSG